MKIKIIIAVFLIHSLGINAQEITIKLNGGPSGILYNTSLGNSELKFGGGLGKGSFCFA